MANQVQYQWADSPVRDAASKGCTTQRVARGVQHERACSPLRDTSKDCYSTPRRQRGRRSTPPPAPCPRRRCGPGGGSFSPPPAPHQARKPALLREIERDSVPQVRQELLRSGSGISSLDNPSFEPALCFAARAGANPEMFRLLLRHGADVNEVNKYGYTALDMLCGLNAPPPLDQSTRRFGDPMSFATDPWSWAAEIMPGSFPSSLAMIDRPAFLPSWAMIDAEVNMLAHLYCFSPFTRSSAAPVSHEPDAHSDETGAQGELAREREERLIEAAKVLLAAGAHVRHEGLTYADSQHQPHRFPRLVQLVKNYAAVSAYRIVGREVVGGAAGTLATHLGQTFGDDLLLRQICSFLAPEGCCFWAIEPR